MTSSLRGRALAFAGLGGMLLLTGGPGIWSDPARAADLTFRRIVVDQQMPRAHMIEPGDFDGDGDIDLVGTSETDNTVVWFEKTGRRLSFVFERHVIDDQLAGSYPLSVADLDQDGDLDVLAAGYQANLYVWYRNDGLGDVNRVNFTRLEIGAIDGPHSIIPVDMDQDGDLDVLTGTQDANRVAWYENDGLQNFTERVIDDRFRRTKTAFPADLDGDGDLDVVATSFKDHTVAWYRNEGGEVFTKFVIGTDFLGAYFGLPADVDKDGDLDIVVASKDDHTISWLRNNGPGPAARPLRFRKIILDRNALGARSVIVRDLDRDRDRDIMAASRNDNTVSWFENRGRGRFSAKRVVSDQVRGAYGVNAIDIDRDRRMDVLSAGRNDGTMNIHRQTTPRRPRR